MIKTVDKNNTSSNLLTVIIPIHDNDERWSNLERIVSSREPGVRFIVAYDGSDKDKFSKPKFLFPEDDYLHGNYEGPGQARNAALALVVSKWTVFCDSDDQPDFCNMLKTIKSSPDFDLIVCQFTAVNNASEYIKIKSPARLKELNCYSFAATPGIWRCIFLTEKIQNQRFLNLRCGEDILFISEFLLIEQRSISFVDLVVYKYNLEPIDSLSKSDWCMMESIKAAKEVMSLVKGAKAISTDHLLLPIFFATRISLITFLHHKAESLSTISRVLRYSSIKLKAELVRLLIYKVLAFRLDKRSS